MDDHLLGYCLNALDDDTRRQVETHLDSHPDDRKRVDRLRLSLRPLEADVQDPAPPSDLVTRTLAVIAESRCQTLPFAPKVSPRQPMRRGWWRRPDVLAASVLFLALSAIGIPWLIHSRQQAGVAECKDNLKHLGQSLLAYADNHDGNFPRVTEDGPNNFAGSFLPLLHDERLVEPARVVNCPGFANKTSNPLTTPQLSTLKEQQRAQYDQAVRDLGGAYAYTLGYRNEHLHGLRKDQDGNVPLMADRPPFGGQEADTGGNSLNHGGRGQNVLYTDGSVRFHPNRTINGDDIFVNRDNKIRAGLDRQDSVLGASDALP